MFTRSQQSISATSFNSKKVFLLLYLLLILRVSPLSSLPRLSTIPIPIPTTPFLNYKIINQLVGFGRECAPVRARALHAPVFLGSLTRQTGRCAPPRLSQLRCSPKNKKLTISRYKNLSLLARTWAARVVYFSTGLSCTLLSYIAFY
jgi:hypothetical protein